MEIQKEKKQKKKKKKPNEKFNSKPIKKQCLRAGSNHSKTRQSTLIHYLKLLKTGEITMTNLFGGQDASEIPDDPFYVAPDTYQCILSEASIVDTQTGGKGLSLKWVIEDEDSDFVGNNISDWHNIYWDEYLSDHDVSEANVRRSRSNMKKRLLDLGVSEEDMETIHENLDDLVGITAYITTVETKDKNDPDKTWVNIRKVEVIGADD